jgi:hypothetical protein
VHDQRLCGLDDLDAGVEVVDVGVDDVVADDAVDVSLSPMPKPMPRAQLTITLFSTSVPRERFQKWTACSAKPSPAQ